MKKLFYFLSIFLVIVILYNLLGSVKSIKTLEFKDLEDTIKDNYYSVVYFGEKNENVDEYLKSFKKIDSIEVYYGKATLDELTLLDLDDSLSSLDCYVLFIQNLPVKVLPNNLSIGDYSDQIKKYFFNIIPSSEIRYKVVEDIDVYIKKVNSKDYTITVYGKTDCNYCTKFLPIVNDIARDYNLDIYYIEKGTFDSDEYNKILNLDLDIPAECTLNNIKTSTLESFPKPMTIITKGGKTVGCMLGYAKKEVLVNKLKEFNLIKE